MQHQPNAPAPGRPSELTPSTIIAAILVAILMGISYPYIVMKLGFGPNVSVVAAFFGFIFLNLIARKSYNRFGNNIVQTAGTSAAQTAFMCVLLGAFDMLRATPGVNFDIALTPMSSFLWLWVACTLGVLLAVPLRRHFIVDEKLAFADGVAVAETLAVLDPPRNTTNAELLAHAKSAARAMLLGLALSGGLMILREEAHLLKWLPDGWVPAAAIGGVALANMGVGVSYSLLSIGSGMLIGLRINLSMILGGILAWVVAPAWLKSAGHLPASFTRTDVLFWVMWPATGMLVAGGLTALAMRWRLLVATFTSLRTMRLDGDEFPISWVISGSLVLSVALCLLQWQLLGVAPWMTVLAILLSLPLMLVGLRVLGETNWGPISALSNMMQGLFAMIAPGHIAANMAASGTTGTIATSSEAIMQDYKAGEIIGSSPRNLTIAQLFAVPIGAAAVAWMYPLLVQEYGLIGENAGLSSPISRKWALFAQFLEAGVSAIPTPALWALLVFSLLGVVLTVLESKPALKKFVPSPTGIGIGILVPFIVISTMCLGGIIGTIWQKQHKSSADAYLVPLASGMIAGEALVAVIVPVLVLLGWA